MFEHFANNSSSLSNQSNDKVSELLGLDPLDLISLQYHTSFPGSDSLNSNNQSDPGARVLYYGVGSIPYGFVNGQVETTNGRRVILKPHPTESEFIISRKRPASGTPTR